ncbi:YktB family protein [Halobacillus sp. B23F22_1]|uniref:YktB family protein n=1 Tax=Halobacillus sp. B23F22_1 TaxID=3459514 RepID=UPI00373DF025
MSEFNGFTQQDFDVFSINGLEDRMAALRENVSPKLEAVAAELAADLTAMTGDEMFVHVAKHARRTTNPPNDTWAALAANKRGYKKLPHFQVGMWGTHVFVWFAVIYESPIKENFAETLLKNRKEVQSVVPNEFVWSLDHTKPDIIPHTEVDDEKLTEMLNRLKTVKKAELLCGITLDRNDERLQDGQRFIDLCRNTFETLLPLYRYTK